MKLAFVATMTAAPWGGSEALWSAAAREALAAGCTVGMSTQHWPERPPAIARLVDEGAVWWPRGKPEPPQGGLWSRAAERLKGPARPATSPQSAFQTVFDFQPDVVCVSQGGTFDFLLHEALSEQLRESAIPYVVLSRFNTDDLIVHEALQERAAAFLTGAYHVGFAAARNLETAERQIAIRLPRASVIQSPMGLPDFAEVPWPTQPMPHLACVARLEVAYKGQDLLLQTLGRPEWRAREWRLSFFGEGPDLARLEHLARFYGLSERVRFAGHVSDIPAVWSTHHLLVLPSRAEGTPQSLVQALICGRPALVTDVGGAADWLTEGRTGFVAEAPNASAIGRALERAWAAREQWGALGRSGHREATARIDRTPGKTLFDTLRAAAVKRPEGKVPQGQTI